MGVNKLRNTAILLMHCPDKPGILAAVTDFINVNKGNILYLDQYVDREAGIFFMRVEWSLDEFLIPKNKIDEYFRTLFAIKFEADYHLYFGDVKPRMAIFVSKMSHCLYDLLARYDSGEWNIDIPCVISNHPDMERVVKKFDIPYYYLPVNKENKQEVEAQELKILKDHDITFAVLARYMQVISANFIDKFAKPIINIHHSTLPAFKGAKPYTRAYDRGVKIIGATCHYVTADLDAGPIIFQDVAKVTHKDTISMLIHRGRDIEKIVFSRGVEKHLERKILVYKNRTIIFQ
ncbi:MAG: formyltetrahydrofolate deformylase [Bacteroidales bacterium]